MNEGGYGKSYGLQFPRVRGNRERRRVRQELRTSIPACAGEPGGCSIWQNLPAFNPRVCGGTHARLGPGLQLALQSPRVRGNRRRPPFPGHGRPSIPACAGMRPAESHTFQYTIDLPQRKSKKRKAKPKATKQPKPERKPKLKQAPKPTTPRTPLSPEERIQRRRAYERQRRATPERQEYNRLYSQEQRRQAKQAGLCRSCPNHAIPNQTRCEVCAEKHQVSRRASRARRQAEQESTVTTVAPPLLDPSFLDDPADDHRLF